ncbi:uncharacterized protein PV06_04641 [Exophiala oligosperma]|uniref:FHA domain-containing protein n=2 Tax=Chaetothyriales TaxID=34395 RepID=A0A0D2DMA6_9EURO|nr:uncharacterized protein PV06_04641 [Exophiala oligosperma]KAJ9620661.1 hypothetical protein H2204_012216 [Knufia peltigerae]KIW43550.1 hypothetical protein PV06_04641 [Exophiala oligosperma]
MSSQAVATSARGLPDFPSTSIDLDDFADQPWPAPSTPRRHASQPQDETEQSPAEDGHSWTEMDAQQRQQAVGNLLAALAPISPEQTATVADGPTMHRGLSAGEGHTPNNHANASEYMMQDTDLGNQNVNANAAISIPPLPPLNNDDFMDENAPPPFPSSLPQDSVDQSQATLLGDDTFTMGQTEPQAPMPSQGPPPERREIEAFAKIEFEDGNYYITTYACELGRDAFAYRAASARAAEARQADQEHAQSSSGRRSGFPEVVSRPGDSQVQGSVVSEAGGFGGVDEAPLPKETDHKDSHHMDSHSSDMSGGSIVKPQEVLINPPLIPFDYHKTAERQAQMENRQTRSRQRQSGNAEIESDNEQPAPVTADHIPTADNCPLIPIHACRTFEQSELENLRSISRRHVKIFWDFDKEWFEMKVLGRNGAFLNDRFLERGEVMRLRDGSKIQISNVWMTFRLPSQRAESITEDSDREEREVDESSLPPRSTSPISDEPEKSTSPPRGGGKTKLKITLTANTPKPSAPQASPPVADPVVGPDGQLIPPKKRGPGRPPKDGIMSTRERKELERARKLAEAKAANGGRTPEPPFLKGKYPAKPAVVKEEPLPIDTKPEKRKYKKRKRSGEEGDVLQSIEGGEQDVPSETDDQPAKKVRQSKSPSPAYPPLESWTEEQLQRPQEPYARLIYDILMEIHPQAMPLKLIYRAIKMRYPFYVHIVESEGWQSSVRHNLNQEWNKLFEKDKKEGKGWAWKAIPGALQPQAERRKAAQQAAASKPKPNPAPRQPPQQGPPPPLNWQNNMSYPPNGMHPQGPPPPFFGAGLNGPVPPPNGMPYPPPFAAGTPSSNPNGPGPHPPGQPPSQFYPIPQGNRPPFPGAALQQPTGKQSAGRPSSSTPGPSPAAAASSSAPNMPCTTAGLLKIREFEVAMYQQEPDARKVQVYQRIFASAKRRMLHGATTTSMAEGDSTEEHVIMRQLQAIINEFRNPNFVGFSNTAHAVNAPVIMTPVPAPIAATPVPPARTATPATTAPVNSPSTVNNSNAANTAGRPSPQTSTIASMSIEKQSPEATSSTATVEVRIAESPGQGGGSAMQQN